MSNLTQKERDMMASRPAIHISEFVAEDVTVIGRNEPRGVNAWFIRHNPTRHKARCSKRHAISVANAKM